MSTQSIDHAASHRFFSTDCFNRAWELLEKSGRSANDDMQMLLLSMTSLWHWTQRSDCDEKNLSIGYWQVSRVSSVLGQAANAAHFGELCLAHSNDVEPFFRAYAHEALAHAARWRA